MQWNPHLICFERGFFEKYTKSLVYLKMNFWLQECRSFCFKSVNWSFGKISILQITTDYNNVLLVVNLSWKEFFVWILSCFFLSLDLSIVWVEPFLSVKQLQKALWIVWFWKYNSLCLIRRYLISLFLVGSTACNLSASFSCLLAF